MLLNYIGDDFISFTSIDDIGMPHTCESWGSAGTEGFPMMLNDGDTYFLYGLFNDPNANIDFPKNVLIDHNMEVKYILEGYNEDLLEFYIQELISSIGN